MTQVAPPPDVEPERVAKALALVDRRGLGLEVGPSHNPMAPKRRGFNVHVVDHLSAAGLREKYADHGVDLDAIEEVDFIWHGEPLAELVGRTHCYDWILASHVIEHLPDPVSFLVGAEALLAPGGVLSLVIPDKRWCFDHLRPVSTTGELLDAFAERRTRPTPGTVFDHVSRAVRRGDAIAWAEGDQRPLTAVHDFTEAKERWAEAASSEAYDDVHVWRFVPASFRLLLADLAALGLTRLAVVREFDTVGFEFFVTLRPDPSPRPAVDRLDLLAEIAASDVGATGDASTTEAAAPPTEPTPVPLDPGAGRPMLVSDAERRLLLAKRQVLESLRRAVSSPRRRP